MKLSQIIRIASTRLGDDIDDIEDFTELFKAYANEGQREIVSNVIKPRTEKTMYTDCDGVITDRLRNVKRVIGIRNKDGAAIPYELSGDGRKIKTPVKADCVKVLAEITYPDMTKDDDEPDIPESLHPAICDYICFRQLRTGNLAQQRRAQAYYEDYRRACSTVDRQGYRGVTAFCNLYSSTSIRS